MADWIFLDHHSCPHPSKELVEQFAKESLGHFVMGAAQKAREKVSTIIGSRQENISLKATLFDAHAHLLFCHYIDFIRETGRTHILTIENEQESILAGIKRLEKFDVQGKILPTDQGRLLETTLQDAVRARSSLLSISWAHPHTGIIQPIHDIIRVCKENDVRIHIDVSAALGKLFFQLSDFDVDFITFDGGLLGMPFPLGVIFSKEKLWKNPKLPFAHYSSLATALTASFDQIETHAMETARLRDFLESSFEKLGATLPYKEIERLPNVAVIQYEGIHSEQITHALKQEAILATSADPFSVSFVLSSQTTQGEIDRVIAVFPKILKKLQKKSRVFTEEDAKAKNMRFCSATVGEKEEGRELHLFLLIDEEDGVIADANFSAFAPPTLHHAAEAACTLLLRKNYMQARRMTADLIEKNLTVPVEDCDLNLIIDAIDLATEACMDIPIEDIYVAPPNMENGERSVYPGWEELSNQQKEKVIAEVMENEIRPYVELDAGGVEVVKVEENRVIIAYSGNCTSCFSATGATLDAIGSILRHKIYPDLMVIPDASVLQT